MKKPNIILITLDGLRLDRVSICPTLNKIANDNIFFSNMIVSTPYTLASMYSIFSGIYPVRNGVNSYFNMFKFKKDKCKTLTQYLKGVGYNTLGSVCSDVLVPNLGFDRLNVYDENKDDIDVNGLKLLNEVSEKEPFFLYLHPSHIHRDTVKNVIKKYDDFDEEYFKNYEKNKLQYDYSVKETDIYLTKILQQVKKLRLDNTIIIILSDHGTSVGDRIGEKAYGSYLYNYTLQTFCIICMPTKISKKIKYRIRSVDILPTILDLVNIPIDNSYEKLDGESVLPFIEQKETSNRICFSETGKLNKEYLEKGELSKGGHYIFSVIEDNWKLIYNKKENTFELFNLEQDKEEKINKIEENILVGAKLKNRILAYLKNEAEDNDRIKVS